MRKKHIPLAAKPAYKMVKTQSCHIPARLAAKLYGPRVSKHVTKGTWTLTTEPIDTELFMALFSTTH